MLAVMVVRTSNLSTGEAETGGLPSGYMVIPDQSELCFKQTEAKQSKRLNKKGRKGTGLGTIFLPGDILGGPK